MTEDSQSQAPIIDPRLQAREEIFQRLHLSIFETMSYANNIQDTVQKTGHDIESDNSDYLQLLRDYEITKNLTPLKDSPNVILCEQTDEIIKSKEQAYANVAQLCAAATSTLNLWRILSEIPEDLREVDEVTKTLKQNYHANADNWEFIIQDLRAQSL